MRTARSILIALFLTAGLAACDTTGPEEPAVAGTWNGTSAVATNPANREMIDLINDQGITLRLTIGHDGSAELRVGLDGFEDVETGTIEFDGGDVTLALEGDPATGTWSMEGDTLELDLTHGVVWDVDGDGLDEPVTMVVVLERVS